MREPTADPSQGQQSVAVTCIVATYGRYTLLKQSLACFLAQTHQAKRMLILNDHPQPIHCSHPLVRVVNVQPRFRGLWEKRNVLLSLVDTPYYAQWDDDDFYLPWHLDYWLKALVKTGKGRIQNRRAFSSRGIGDGYLVVGLNKNKYESAGVGRTVVSRRCGFQSSPCRADTLHVEYLDTVKMLHEADDPRWASLIYGWDNETHHLQNEKDAQSVYDVAGDLNKDVSEHDLTPCRIVTQLEAYLQYVSSRPDAPTWYEPKKQVRALLEEIK